MIVITYGILQFLVCFWHLSCSTDMNCEVGRTCEEVPAASSCTSLAVVPYDDEQISELHRPKRRFQFSEHVVSLEQNWREVGVAAVVWDAVCELICSFKMFTNTKSWQQRVRNYSKKTALWAHGRHCWQTLSLANKSSSTDYYSIGLDLVVVVESDRWGR